MKLNKLMMAGLLALASVTGASAAGNIIHIVGSTAYRASVNDAIGQILNTGYLWCNTTGTTAANIASASTSQYIGTIKSGFGNNNGSGQTITIDTAFSGSIAGLADMAQGIKVNFIPAGSATSSAGTKYTGSVNESGTADFAWTDTDFGTDKLIVKNAVSSAAYNAIANKNYTEAGSQGQGADGGQGIVFFELVEEAITSGLATPFTNISTDNLATLITQGYISLAALSGTDNATTEATDIVLTGRSEDSGSRGNVFSCAFEGATSSIGSLSQVQYQGSFRPSSSAGSVNASYTDNGAVDAGLSSTVYVGGTSSVLYSLNLWPAGWGLNSDTTIYWSPAGHSGFNSGGNVATALSATDGITNVSFTDGGGNPASAVYVVGYLGGNDAASVAAVSTNAAGTVALTGTSVYNTSGARALRIAYNGQQYSQAGVLNGSYGLWGYEHAYYISNGPAEQNTVEKAAMDDVADEVFGVTAQDDNLLQENQNGDVAAGIFLQGFTGSGGSGGTEEVERGGPGQPITTENDY